ncbi:TetR/AcrR family transcriptional regulator [Symbiopectobacterium sp.]|uniref:TetR/AcrR family transcriptional regulator n=1 Tax=Symbiopectobacterium sp. TaxID=2952789 RepID=UPI003F356F3A
MARNREEIIQVSSQLFRERGLNGVSVNDLMAAAGLTHGGFYGHFSSKDELAAIASRKALDDSASRWQEIRHQSHHHDDLRTLVEAYLSTTHRDAAKDGCPITALASDVAREGEAKPVRDVYFDGVKAMLERLASVSDIRDAEQRRQHVLVQLSLLLGALTLARATAGDALSDEFLLSAKNALIDDAV